jgi:hypothetical protein
MGEGGFVGGFQNHTGGAACIEGIAPTAGTETPAIAGFEAGESVAWGGQIVALVAGVGKKRRSDLGANHVNTEILGAGFAAAVAQEAGHGIGATGLELGAENIAGGHGGVQKGCVSIVGRP